MREETLNKLELIQGLKSKTNLTKLEATEVVNLFFSEITNAFLNDERVEIRGLCSFYVKKYKSYTGRNPKTGKKVTTAPKKLPFLMW